VASGRSGHDGMDEQREQARRRAEEYLREHPATDDRRLGDKQAGGVGIPPEGSGAWPRSAPPRRLRLWDAGDVSAGVLDSLPRLSPAEASRVVGYLRSGTLILDSGVRQADRFEPARGEPIGGALRTDGSWVWDEAVEYYIENYGVSPGRAFLDYLAARDYQARRPTSDEIDAAVRSVLGGEQF
jgi:hypothetical protein